MDLDDRVSALVGQLVDFGEGFIDLPEILTLDDEVDPMRLLECFQTIFDEVRVALPTWRHLYYHPRVSKAGSVYFHGKGIKHGEINMDGQIT